MKSIGRYALIIGMLLVLTSCGNEDIPDGPGEIPIASYHRAFESTRTNLLIPFPAKAHYECRYEQTFPIERTAFLTEKIPPFDYAFLLEGNKHPLTREWAIQKSLTKNGQYLPPHIDAIAINRTIEPPNDYVHEFKLGKDFDYSEKEKIGEKRFFEKKIRASADYRIAQGEYDRFEYKKTTWLGNDAYVGTLIKDSYPVLLDDGSTEETTLKETSIYIPAVNKMNTGTVVITCLTTRKYNDDACLNYARKFKLVSDFQVYWEAFNHAFFIQTIRSESALVKHLQRYAKNVVDGDMGEECYLYTYPNSKQQ